jgi:hypothetical protein
MGPLARLACVGVFFTPPPRRIITPTSSRSTNGRTQWQSKCLPKGSIGGMASRDYIQRMSATIHDGRMGVAHNQGSRQTAMGTISMADLQLSYLPE